MGGVGQVGQIQVNAGQAPVGVQAEQGHSGQVQWRAASVGDGRDEISALAHSHPAQGGRARAHIQIADNPPAGDGYRQAGLERIVGNHHHLVGIVCGRLGVVAHHHVQGVARVEQGWQVDRLAVHVEDTQIEIRVLQHAEAQILDGQNGVAGALVGDGQGQGGRGVAYRHIAEVQACGRGGYALLTLELGQKLHAYRGLVRIVADDVEHPVIGAAVGGQVDHVDGDLVARGHGERQGIQGALGNGEVFVASPQAHVDLQDSQVFVARIFDQDLLLGDHAHGHVAEIELVAGRIAGKGRGDDLDVGPARVLITLVVAPVQPTVPVNTPVGVAGSNAGSVAALLTIRAHVELGAGPEAACTHAPFTVLAEGAVVIQAADVQGIGRAGGTAASCHQRENQ